MATNTTKPAAPAQANRVDQGVSHARTIIAARTVAPTIGIAATNASWYCWRFSYHP